MKVIHVLKTSKGAAWALKLMHQQVLAGVNVHVVMPDNLNRVKEYQLIGVKVHTVEGFGMCKNPLCILKGMYDFRRLIKNEQPDIVSSHFVITTILMRFSLCGCRVPRVFQIPGPLHLENKITSFIESKISGKRDFWIATCKWVQEKYLSLGKSKSKVFLSYYGTDVDSFNSIKHGHGLSICNFSDLNKLSAETFVIGMVAYMYPPKKFLGQKKGLKGHEDLIDAIGLLLQKGHDVKVVFVGKEWGGGSLYEEAIKDYAKKMVGDKAIFLGERSDVKELYKCFDCAVYPSHSENVGGAVESLLMGVPTITTNVGGFPDLVINGSTGINVPVKSPELLANAIEKYITDSDRRELDADNGRMLAERMFDVKKTALDLIKIYNEVIDNAKKDV